MNNKDSPGLRKLVYRVLRSFDMFREDKDSGRDPEDECLDYYVESGMLTLGNTVAPDPKCKICMQGVDQLLIIDGDRGKELVEKLIGVILGVDPSTVIACPSVKQAAHMVRKCVPGSYDWGEDDLEFHGQCLIDDLRRL